MLPSDRTVAFVNHLKITSDLDEWIKSLLVGLHQLCPDVDRFSVNINLFCDPFRPKKIDPEKIETSVRFNKVGKDKSVTISHHRESDYTEEYERDLLGMVDLSDCHRPIFYHYFLENGEPLSSITLIREKKKAPVSQETLDLLSSLEPFMKYLFASIIAMHRNVEPFLGAFRDTLFRLQAEAGFSQQEERVMTLKLLGYSYKMIAAEMNVSLNTVRTHIKGIHRKTGTRSYTELFAKYFTPVAREFLP